MPEKMPDESRAELVNMIVSAYSDRVERLKVKGTEAGLRTFADGFMAAVRMMTNVGWRRDTREGVYAALRASCMVNGWALIAAEPPAAEGGKGYSGVPPDVEDTEKEATP